MTNSGTERRASLCLWPILLLAEQCSALRVVGRSIASFLFCHLFDRGEREAGDVFGQVLDVAPGKFLFWKKQGDNRAAVMIEDALADDAQPAELDLLNLRPRAQQLANDGVELRRL